MKQSRVIEFLTENPEACKHLYDENFVDADFS